MDEKLDSIIQMLSGKKHHPHPHPHHHHSKSREESLAGLSAESPKNDDLLGTYNYSIYHSQSDSASKDELLPPAHISHKSFSSPSLLTHSPVPVKRKRGMTLEPAELQRRLEILKDSSESSAESLGAIQVRRTDSRFTVTPTILTPDFLQKSINEEIQLSDNSLNVNEDSRNGTKEEYPEQLRNRYGNPVHKCSSLGTINLVPEKIAANSSSLLMSTSEPVLPTDINKRIYDEPVFMNDINLHFGSQSHSAYSQKHSSVSSPDSVNTASRHSSSISPPVSSNIFSKSTNNTPASNNTPSSTPRKSSALENMFKPTIRKSVSGENIRPKRSYALSIQGSSPQIRRVSFSNEYINGNVDDTSTKVSLVTVSEPMFRGGDDKTSVQSEQNGVHQSFQLNC